VSQAILKVLQRAPDGLRTRDIHRHVEQLLGGQVSRSSIKNHLAKNCHGEMPRFQRLGRGRYRLA